MTNSATIIEDLTLVPVPAWWENPWVWVGALVALVVAGYLFRRWLKSRPVPVIVAPPVPTGPPPHLEALRRLTELRAKQEKLTTYDVALECSDILRAYIEGRFALPIRYQTTPPGQCPTRRRELSRSPGATAHPRTAGPPGHPLGNDAGIRRRSAFVRLVKRRGSPREIRW